jgi:raffinose/stachyose/melibiose transport system substrate-binding protein
VRIVKAMGKMKACLCSIVIAAATMSGCVSSDTAGGNQEGGNGSEAGQPVEVSFVTARSDIQADNQVYEKIVENYNNEQNEVKVNLKLTDFGDTGNDHRTWVTTQLIGGASDEIIRSRYIWSHDDYGKELIQDLNEYLNMPNPYNQDKKWVDTFSPSIMQSMTVPTTDKIAGIPTQSLAVRVFYNKKLFEKAGIDAIPETWDEFMDVQGQLLDNEITPMGIGFAKQGGDRPNWMIRYLSDQVSEHIVPDLDLDRTGMITSNEIVSGVDKGIIDFSKAPWNGIFPIIKDWSQYWPEGFEGMTAQDAQEMFLREEAAMTLDLPNFARDIEGMIDYGVMRVPYLTKNNHPDAQEKFYEVAAGNPDGVYVIPKEVSKEKMEAAIDFLMYLTSPDVQQMMAEELYVVPVLMEDKFPENITPFLITNEPFKMNLFGPAFSKDLYETLGQYGSLYLTGEMQLGELTEKLNQAAENTAEDLKTSQGWNEDNNYGIKKE